MNPALSQFHYYMQFVFLFAMGISLLLAFAVTLFLIFYYQYVGRYKVMGRAFREGWEEGDED